MQWLRELATWMVGLAQTPVGPWSLFWLACAESSFFPLPPDLLLVALDLLQPANSFWFAAVCTVGSALGGIGGYAIGRWGGRPLLDRVLRRETITAVQTQFQKYDVWAVAIAGFTPIPYKVFTIAGGAFQLHFWRFLAVSVLSRGARFFLVSAVVFLFREQAERLLRDYFEIFTVAFMVLLLGGFLVVRRVSRGLRAAQDQR